MSKSTVIEKDNDNLSASEIAQNAEAVAAADLKELQTWQHYECMARAARSSCRNIIDCRWVRKWKNEEQPDGTIKRYIRSRLTVRGFKDKMADSLDTFAATSTRPSQRMVVSVAAQRGWDLSTADIQKAFLQGMTYKEMAKVTGEPERDVAFALPSSTIGALRRLPGYANFDPTKEVLKCLKPGTGLKDAPQAFSMKLRSVTAACNLTPSLLDSELLMKHSPSGRLLFVMSVHVDDLKFAGEPEVVDSVTRRIQQTFGQLRIIKHTFTNCGVKHTQNPRDHSVTLDQHAYIQTFKPVADPEMMGKHRKHSFPNACAFCT